ncbi:MAG TPA: AEC family transporter, partial [Ramlibacter sp.]|nr:AEC family transporter [Ramlibacter sp.]
SGWMAINGVERSVMVLSAALPIGANVFLFSQRYGVAQDEVTAGVAMSTLLAVPGVAIVLMLMS